MPDHHQRLAASLDAIIGDAAPGRILTEEQWTRLLALLEKLATILLPYVLK